MVRKSRITLSKPKTAASRKETHERVNEQAEKATRGERIGIAHARWIPVVFVSNKKRRERESTSSWRVHIHTCDIPYVTYAVLYPARRRSLTCIHAAIFIVAGCCSKLVLCTRRGARARPQILDKSTVKPETSLYRLTSSPFFSSNLAIGTNNFTSRYFKRINKICISYNVMYKSIKASSYFFTRDLYASFY